MQEYVSIKTSKVNIRIDFCQHLSGRFSHVSSDARCYHLAINLNVTDYEKCLWRYEDLGVIIGDIAISYFPFSTLTTNTYFIVRWEFFPIYHKTEIALIDYFILWSFKLRSNLQNMNVIRRNIRHCQLTDSLDPIPFPTN